MEVEKDFDHALDHHLFLLKRVLNRNQRNTKGNLLQDLDQGIMFINFSFMVKNI